MKAIITNRNDLWDVVELPVKHDDPAYGQPPSKALFRDDNKRWLATVDNTYQVAQNKALYDVVSKVAKGFGMNSTDMEFAEYLDGRKISFQLEIPTWDLDGDIVKRYFSILTGHDGNNSVGIDCIGNRIFCMNQWYDTMSNALKIKHTGDIEAKLSEIAEMFTKAFEEDAKLQEQYLEFKHQEFPDELDIEVFAMTVFGYDDDPETVESKRKMLNVDRMVESINKNIDEIGPTKWALFNGVTYYTNHIINRNEKQHQYLRFNTGSKLNSKAISLLKDL